MLVSQGGTKTILDATLGGGPIYLAGAYDQVALIVSQVEPTQRATQIRYSASWDGNQAFTSEEIRYDDGTAISGKFFTLSAGSNGAVATRFELPSLSAGTTLDKAHLSPLFLSQFSNGGQPSDAPRDIIFRIWDDSGHNRPGQEIFSLPVEDTRAFFNASTTLTFLEVDLGAYADQLNNLPATIYLGYSEAGTDQNYLVAGISPYTVENVSFTGNIATGTWTRLWDVTTGGTPVGETVLPIRATFLVPTGVASEAESVLPDLITLEQNYPNPFNPATSIRYSLPHGTHVRLGVFDVLGRRIALLVDGGQQAGTYEVTIDASNWNSGLYFYSLESSNQILTRKMALAK